MKVAILTSVSAVSSKQLAEHLRENGIQADVFKPFEDNQGDPWKAYDYLFKYGCSYAIPNGTFGKGRDRVLNNTEAVHNCVDKRETFRVFRDNDIPTVSHWTDPRAVPLDVETLVVRESARGRKAEGYSLWERGDGKPIPRGELYTEYYYHTREYRLTIFKGQAFLHYKQEEDGMHNFIPVRDVRRAKNLIADGIKAAKALNMDFVSFDVLTNTYAEYKFLEANSGTLLTDEVSLAIVQWFLDKE